MRAVHEFAPKQSTTMKTTATHNRRNRAFTLIELILILKLCLGFAAIGLLLFVAVHFVIKHW